MPRYENPVNLYISKSYDDAETAQNFIKALAGEQLTVSKSRNGDYLYVSLKGSDEDIDAFLDVYKDTFTDIVWDCDADANGWVKPKDVYDSIGQDGKVLPEESKVGEGRSNEDYLQEVWDSLAVAWDKDKFNMGKGYDSEYECECITITPKDNEEVRANIYVEDYNGRHPAAFNVVYRYPGDKGVGVMGTYEFQSTDMDGLGEEVFDYFDEIKQKAGESKKSEAKGPTTGDDALKQMQTAFKQYNGKTTGEIAADIRYDVATALDMPADEVDDVMQSFGLDNIYILRAEGVSPKAIAQKMLKASNEAKKSEDFDMNKAFFQAKKAITDWTKNQKHKTLEWLYTDGRKSPTSYPSGIWDFEWDTGNGMAMAELKVSPYETRTNSWNDSLDFALKSGPEGKYMYYTSAEDVLYALDKLIRDTEFKGESKKSESDETSWALEYLVETAKEKGLKVSWEGSNEICITIGTFPLQDHIFVTDDAPGKDDTSLELYVPAAHINTSGLTLQDVLDYLDDPIGKRDAVQFKNGNRPGKVEANKSEGLPPKKLGSNRQYRSRADLINKMKTLDAVEITTPAQFNDIHSKQWLHTAGYALDTNGNLIGQTYFGDKDGKWYYATTKTFQGDYLPECKEEAKKSEKASVTCSICGNPTDDPIWGEGNRAFCKDCYSDGDDFKHGKTKFVVGMMISLDGVKQYIRELKPRTFVGQSVDTGKEFSLPISSLNRASILYDPRNESKKSEAYNWIAFYFCKDKRTGTEYAVIPQDRVFVVGNGGGRYNLSYLDANGHWDRLSYGYFATSCEPISDPENSKVYATVKADEDRRIIALTESEFDTIVEADDAVKTVKSIVANNYESKKSESLTLKQKELKDMARYGQAEDITTISDAEAKELKKKGIETVGISRGVYGMNGALLRDKDGNKYVITARSSNLFYFV